MTETTFFFENWQPIVRILVVGVPMYVALVALLRISGSRTLASMNVFDFIVTVAIGSAFGRALTSKTVAFAEAVTAFGLLIGLQYTVAWIATRWPRFRHVITNPPRLLYFRGEFLHQAMRRQRVTEDEIRSAVRKQKVGTMDDVEAVVLESSGDVSVVTSAGDESAMVGLTGDGDDPRE